MTFFEKAKKIFAVSNIATVLVCLYAYVSTTSMYNLMYPLNNVDVGSYPPDRLVKPYWGDDHAAGGNDERGMGMKIYVSTNPEFHIDFMVDEFRQKRRKGRGRDDGGSEAALPRKQTAHDTVLLWEDPSVSSSSTARSFVITCDPENEVGGDGESGSESFEAARRWLEDAEVKAREDARGGVQAVLSSAKAGEGIASTSVLLSLYGAVSDGITGYWKGGKDEDAEGAEVEDTATSVVVLPVSKTSSIWSSLMNNSTLHVHVLLQRHASPPPKTTPDTFHAAHRTLNKSSRNYDLLFGQVDLVKYSPPHHVPKPRRYLYLDASYALRRYLLHTPSSYAEPAPWDMASAEASTAEYQAHRETTRAKERGEGYPYWKPEVAIKLVRDLDVYPTDHVHRSGMQTIRTPPDATASAGVFESGIAHLPGLHVDEIGLTSEKYVPVNRTLDSLPLRISFAGHDGGEDDGGGEGITPARWRLLSHLSRSLESQQELGFGQSDIDDVRRLVADTNVLLLGVTMLASTLHLLFEFLTFKTEVEFWKGNTDLTGLSVRALFMDFVSQVVILLFLMEEETSLLMTVPSAFGCAVALWKCQRGAGFRFVNLKTDDDGGDGSEEEKPSVWNRFFRVFGYELRATRLRAARRKRLLRNADDKPKTDDGRPVAPDLAALSEETDRLATRTLGLYLLLPLVLSYTAYTLLRHRHAGWYSWFITSASTAVYALGFVLMTPQLFLNYRLKSVAHLPWKVLGFRFVNTFIDDLFAFIIRMPTMARISCFRDDVVFLVYLWQRYLYPVDESRPVEGGGMDAVSAAANNAVVVDETEEEEKKGKKGKKKKQL